MRCRIKVLSTSDYLRDAGQTGIHGIWMFYFLRNLARRALSRTDGTSIRGRLLHGAFWSSIGDVWLRGLVFAATVVVVRLLGKEQFGQYVIVIGAISIFQGLATFGLGKTANRYVAQFRKNDPQRASRILALTRVTTAVTGGIMAVLMFATAPFLAQYALRAPHLAPYLRITAIVLFFSAMDIAQVGTLSGMEAFQTIARCNALGGVIAFLSTVLGVYIAGIPGGLWGMALAAGAKWGINAAAVRREARRLGLKLVWSGFWQERAILWSFSLPLLLGMLVVGPTNWACRVFLANQPAGFSSLGMFGAALTIQTITLVLAGALCRPLLPILSSQNRDHSKLSYANIMLSWMFGLCICTPIISFPVILRYVFGQEFGSMEFERVIVLVGLTTLLMVIRQGIVRAVVSKGMMWLHFLSAIVLSAASMTASLLLVRYGAAGLAGSFLLAQITVLALFVPIFVYRRVVPRRALISVGHAIVWTAVIASAMLSWQQSSLLIRLVPLVVIYAAAAIWLVDIVRTRDSSKPSKGEA